MLVTVTISDEVSVELRPRSTPMSSNANSIDVRRAAELKALGDSAYRSKDLVKAQLLYSQSAQLHNLPTTRSNLSASEYELGLYDPSINNAKEAIALNDLSDTPSPSLRSKNQLRLCRALATLKRTIEAVGVAKDLLRMSEASDPLRPNALNLLGDLEHVASLHPTKADVGKGYVASLPLFRPPGEPVMEYYTVSLFRLVLARICIPLPHWLYFIDRS